MCKNDNPGEETVYAPEDHYVEEGVPFTPGAPGQSDYDQAGGQNASTSS